MKTAQQAASKWQQNAGGSSQAWEQGIQQTTVDVAARAIAQAPAAIAAYTQSLSSGAWARAIQASGGTSYWKAQSQQKSANYATGIQAGAPKYQASIGKLMPAIESLVAGLPSRGPAGSPANITRVTQMMQGLHAQKGNFKG